MTDISLEGKVALVTGAGRGLGREMSLALLGAGAAVTMLELDAAPLEGAGAEARDVAGADHVLCIEANVTVEADAARAIAETTAKFGRLDVLVNNAAMGPQFFRTSNLATPPKVWEVDLDLWRRVQLVNATGPYTMARSAIPAMIERGWGRIVNVTTSLDTMYRETMGPYGPAKAALEALTLMLALELDGTGVTSNVLIPGGQANTRMIPNDGKFVDRTLLVQPEVMRAPIRWLASDSSNGITGMRFIAARWDPDQPDEANVEAAGAPGAWQQLGRQAIRDG